MKKIAYILILSSLVCSQEHVSLASGIREYYNYELKDHNKVVYRGQTKNPHIRELEHYRDGKKFTHMKVNGKAKTLQGALKEEKKTLETYRKNHKGKNPKYNKTDRG